MWKGKERVLAGNGKRRKGVLMLFAMAFELCIAPFLLELQSSESNY